ncbi:hypothetical protein [Enterovibrio norvegicus]|uniref:hypothetical protein n=1 Tax=Enterovibrio norvegicus TaxID=188144 RepID=UPI001056C506|nr:hypothetical protein [Enterovibrio norvegicus]
MAKTNELMQRQTTWLIRNSLSEQYTKHIDRIYMVDSFSEQQRQFSLDSVIDIVSQQELNYSLSELNLDDLLLGDKPAYVSIRDSLFSGELLKYRKLHSYFIYGSKLRNITLGDYSNIYPYFEFRNVGIERSIIENSYFLGVNFYHSKLSGEIHSTDIAKAEFCGTQINIDFYDSKNQK